MDDLITWKDFADFSDDTPIEDLKSGIKQMKDSFSSGIDSISKDMERLGGEYAGISQEAVKFLGQLEKMNSGIKSNQDMILKSADSIQALTEAAMKNNAAQEQSRKTTDSMKKAVDDLNKAEEKLKSTQEAEAGSLADLKAQLDAATKAYVAMGDATDESVKADQLKKIEDLNKQYKEQKQVLDDAKKSVTFAAGSYDELNARVSEGRKRLKAMSGGVEGNSEEFKKLKKEVSDGTKKLKAWDEEVGVSNRNVGDYAGEIGKLIPGFQQAAGAVDMVTKSGYTLIASPLGAFLVLIAAALAAVSAWFTRTETGGDKFAEIMERISAIASVLLDGLAKIGEAIFNTFSNPQKMLQDFKQLMIDIWNDPMKYMEQFANFLKDQIINRFTAVGVAVEGLNKILHGDFKAGFKDLGNAAIQATLGIENGIEKIANAIDPLLDKLAKADELGKQLAKMKDELEDQEVALILKRAKTELQVNSDLLKAKDKLRQSDEDRYKAIKNVTKISEDLLDKELAAAQLAIDIAKKEIEIRKLTLTDAEIPLDLIKQQNEAEAKLLGLKAKRLQEQKRLQQQEISIIREVETEMLNRIKRERDAEFNLQKALNDIRLKANQEIINDTKKTLGEKIIAITASNQTELEMLDDNKQKQIDVAKETALARIELNGDALEKIYNDETLSLQERIALERKAKEDLLHEDEAYVKEVEKINAEYLAGVDETNKKAKQLVEDNIYKQLTADFEAMNSLIKTKANEELTALNQAFVDGQIKTVEDYESQRATIEDKARKASLKKELDYLKEKAAAMAKYGQDTQKIQEQISAVELALSEQTAAKELEIRKMLEDAKANLAQAAVQGAMTIVANLAQAEDQRLQEKMDKLTAAYEQEVTLAGDNAERKKELENAYQSQVAAIEAKRKDAKRKAAIFEKAVSLTQAAVNTALAVTQALGSAPPPANFILAALVGAAGAIQIASIASKPIPQFAVGTESSPEGFAIINELGPELVVTPRGDAHIVGTDGPTLAYLPGGSKVFTAAETEHMLNEPILAHQMLAAYNADAEGIKLVQENGNRELVGTLSRKLDSLEQTIANKKEFHLTITKGGVKYAVQEGLNWTEYLNTFYK